MEQNTDRLGNDYKKLTNLRDASVCNQKCQIENRCLAWTFVKKNTIQGPKSQCYLKDKIPNPRYNTATISGVKNRSISVQQKEYSNAPSTDEIKRYIAHSGDDIYFSKLGIGPSAIAGLMIGLNELVGGTSGINLQTLRASALKDEECNIADQLQNCKLKIIADMIKQNGQLKLYVSIKNKAAGLANARVKSMKSYLALYGLTPGSEYHVQKVSKNDKKKREWLSQNSHLWMRVAPKRD